MIQPTNSLVAKVKKFAVSAVRRLPQPSGCGNIRAFNHSVAHAAAIVPGAPMDESSVSSLQALDNAVEAVAARVTPAVVKSCR